MVLLPISSGCGRFASHSVAATRFKVAAAFAVILGLGGLAADAAVFLDFETPGQYAANFRPLLHGTTASQTAEGVANDYVAVQAGSGTSPLIAIYDTTPVDGAARTVFGAGSYTVSMDVRAGASNTSYGLFLIPSTATSGSENTANSILALTNVNGSGNNEQMRFFSPTRPDVSTVTNQYNGVLTTNGTNNSGSVLRDAGAVTNEFSTLTFNITTTGTTASITMQIGDFYTTVENLAFNTAEFQIGIRVSDVTQGGSTGDFDNFAIIPEPGAGALLALGGAALLARRRRR